MIAPETFGNKHNIALVNINSIDQTHMFFTTEWCYYVILNQTKKIRLLYANFSRLIFAIIKSIKYLKFYTINKNQHFTNQLKPCFRLHIISRLLSNQLNSHYSISNLVKKCELTKLVGHKS
jgi:hypothetical protein